MAIYRSDQAVVTFGAEAVLGGHPEAATSASTTSGTASLNGAHEAGAKYLTVSSHSGIAVGDIIRIGAVTLNNELRKVVHIANSNTTYYIDAPTSAYHPTSAAIAVVTLADADQDKYITFIPGVYDTVTTPDMTPTIEPRYFLGTGAKRNFTAAYKGTQAYNGAIPSFILLNAAALRFPIGRIMDTASTTTSQATSVLALNGASKRGDQYITWNGSGATGFTTSVYASIGTQVTDPNGSEPREIIKIVSNSGSAGASRLAYPLKYDHANDAPIQIVSGTFTHTILETNQLDSVAMNVHMRDSGETAANDFDRRFFGGKVGAATISAEEGGLLVMGWDTVPFMGTVHNQFADPNSTIGTNIDVPFSGTFQTIEDDNIGSKTTDASAAITMPTDDPYYFSQGTVSMFGTDFARVRNFSISINNNVEPRYYIERRGDTRQRGPSDIVEMRREYTMTATIALPDSIADTADTTTLFKQLMLEGDYGAGMRGFNIRLLFTRGTNDTIQIDIPDDGTNVAPSASGGAAVGLNEQGAYLTEAPHPIDGSNPFEVSASLIFRSMKIVVIDSEPMYP